MIANIDPIPAENPPLRQLNVEVVSSAGDDPTPWSNTTLPRYKGVYHAVISDLRSRCIGSAYGKLVMLAYTSRRTMDAEDGEAAIS
jgi:hypothetical protein